MNKTTEIYVLSILAFLSGATYLGVPFILLLSDFEQGGIVQIWTAMKVPEYDEIRLMAFYVPVAAFFLFLILTITLLTKSKTAIPMSLLCFIFSAWSLSQINNIGMFGLIISGWYLINTYKQKYHAHLKHGVPGEKHNAS